MNICFRNKLLKTMIVKILYDLARSFNLSFFSVSSFQISSRGDSLKVYLIFLEKKKEEEILAFLNRDGVFLLKKRLASSHKFSYIPWIKFFSDEVFN